MHELCMDLFICAWVVEKAGCHVPSLLLFESRFPFLFGFARNRRFHSFDLISFVQHPIIITSLLFSEICCVAVLGAFGIGVRVAVRIVFLILLILSLGVRVCSFEGFRSREALKLKMILSIL